MAINLTVALPQPMPHAWTPGSAIVVSLVLNKGRKEGGEKGERESKKRGRKREKKGERESRRKG